MRYNHISKANNSNERQLVASIEGQEGSTMQKRCVERVSLSQQKMRVDRNMQTGCLYPFLAERMCKAMERVSWAVIKCDQIILGSKFEFVVEKTVLLELEMSQNATNQTQPKALNETLSKRQQMKLNQAIKIIQSQEIQQTKQPKRRATSHLHHNQQNPRKQIKIDSNINIPISEDIISSSSQSVDPSSLTPPLQHQKSHTQAQHLNPNYEVPEGQGALFNYLLCYSYSQGEKQFQKQNQDWKRLDMLEGQGLEIVKNSISAKMCKRLESKFREQKDKLKEPLGRNHRQFGQKFFKKEFLLE